MKGPKPRSLADRFEEKVDRSPGQGPNGDCHEWTACTSGKGYGRISVGGHDGPLALAHRVAWFLATGRWPEPCALHTCDNPRCVRFEHLFEGTVTDNAADCRAKGRSNRGERHGCAKLTDAAAREIREADGTYRIIAARYGVSPTTVSLVKRHKRWAHV